MTFMLDDQDLLRYSRHILLNELDVAGVEKIRQAKIVIVGVGGLGSIAALYLAASGVGHITLIDHDLIDLTNLQRQVAFSMSDLAHNKAQSCAAAMGRINPDVKVHVITERFEDNRGDELLHNADVVLDCSDNFATRHLLNRLCVKNQKPLVSGAAIRFDGQLTVFDPRVSTNPCYECLFPDNREAQEEACATMGVLSPLVGMIGSAQAVEALKIITGSGETLVGRLMLFNALRFDCHEIKYQQDPVCPVCRKDH